MSHPKRFLWITREDSTRGHLSHALAALDGQFAASTDELRILTVAPDRPAAIPEGYRLITGEPVAPGAMSDAELPKQGLLLVAV
ncbi:hypothetical protein GCM10010910_21580 [Microbacterium nanhaiense]|uniref:Uncharacterized protein n=1 Tax=Microbacterium nanhaiense TaxID=1301026 RepID=A0ABQ2N314_9MICO|nr:hypothetical protein [Microbacterium nanhaiense]GGO65120.1 hypothetical protein GCM10010910_21580 [Microbacterium nanhaiense]